MDAVLLKRTARLLAGTADFRDTLERTLSACLPALGDFGFFDATAPDGTVVRVSRAHEDVQVEAILRPTQWTRSERRDMNLCALSSGEPALHAEIDDAWYRAVAVDADHLAVLRRLAFRSMATVPLRYRGELIGALTLFMGRSGRRHDAHLYELAQDVAALASPVVANAALMESLRVSEERLRVSVQSARIGIWEWRLADDSVYWSPEYREMYGLGAHEAPSFARGMAAVVPEDVPAIEESMRLTLSEGTEFSALHRVRHPVHGVRFLHSIGRPIAGEDGRPARVLGVVFDVSDQQRNARERDQLREQLAEELQAMRRLHQISSRHITREESLEDLLGEVLDAALEITGRERGVIRLVDDADESLVLFATRGFPASFADGMTHLPRESTAPSATCWRRAERVIIEDIAADPDFSRTPGGMRLMRHGVNAVQATPLVSRSGQVVGTLATHGMQAHSWTDRELRLLDMLSREAADYIERAKADTQLKEADRRKDEFLAILAHELRNPLAPIRYAISISREPGSSEQQRRRAESVIERQVAHMGRLLDDLLDVSRIARGTVQLKRQRVLLEGVAQAAIEASRPLVEAKAHELVVTGLCPMMVDADPVRLTQVLTNLLNNAAKYTEPHGRIELGFTATRGDLCITVSDNGVGIAEDVRPRLFTLFAQAQGAAQRAEGGLGIGLALVKGFVELHGGRVEATSEGPGRGTRFTVWLPDAVVDGEEAGTSAARARRGGSLRVLVADDNPDICDMCATLLKLWGHESIIAATGVQALDLLLRERPDVAVLDLGMPRMSGYEVARAARERLGRDIVLIAVTGWGQEEARAQTAAAGFDHHLTKPVDAARLEALLARVQDTRRVPVATSA